MTTVLAKRHGVKCLIENNKRFLLVKLSYAHKKWTLPGGGVEVGESFEEAARRELEEETGVKMSNLKFLGEYESRKEDKHRVQCFYGTTDSAETALQASEISEAAWFSIHDLPAERSENVDGVLALFLHQQTV